MNKTASAYNLKTQLILQLVPFQEVPEMILTASAANVKPVIFSVGACTLWSSSRNCDFYFAIYK